jgi:uncharacterized protein (DUF488 family)
MESHNVRITIWTVGYSNYSLENFLELLKENRIEVLIDIRRFPTSKMQHFRKEEMEEWLPRKRVEYVWLGKELGGYRKGGYQKYMQTKMFREGVKKLLEIAKTKRVCIMCIETNPKYCHRRFISTYLERKGVKVTHIIRKGQRSLTTEK